MCGGGGFFNIISTLHCVDWLSYIEELQQTKQTLKTNLGCSERCVSQSPTETNDSLRFDRPLT